MLYEICGHKAFLDSFLYLSCKSEERKTSRPPKDLHFEEVGLVETLVDVAKLSEELHRFVPDILVLLVDKKQLGLESEVFILALQCRHVPKSHRQT